MKYNIMVREVLEREVEVTADTDADAVMQVEDQYHDEEIVLDYSDLVSTDIVPVSIYKLIILDTRNDRVIMYHLQERPDDIESWLQEHYKDYSSECKWIITDKEVEHEYY